MLNEIFNYLFPGKAKEQKQIEEIVETIENRVRQLSNLPPNSTRDSTSVLLPKLNHIDLLIERLLNNQVINESSVDTGNVIPNHFIAESLVKIDIAEENKETVSILPSTPEIILEPTLSKTAKELIDLRDWILLAKTGSNLPGSEIFNVLYQRLGKILEQEGVNTLEEQDKFNYECQQIVSTKPTNDPDKNDMIAETIRPGYTFNNSIIRPQEVIIYTAT